MKDDLKTTIEREVKSWPGVITGDTGRGGLQQAQGASGILSRFSYREEVAGSNLASPTLIKQRFAGKT